MPTVRRLTKSSENLQERCAHACEYAPYLDVKLVGETVGDDANEFLIDGTRWWTLPRHGGEARSG